MSIKHSARLDRCSRNSYLQSQSGGAGAAEGTSGLRNNAFARIMNRPERPKPPQSVKAPRPETEKKQEPASAIEVGDQHSTEPKPPPEMVRVAPLNLEIERGNRMIEKLMGSKTKSQAWRDTSKDTTSHPVEPREPVAVSPAPAPAPIAQTKTVNVLERIEETLREEMNTTVEVTPSTIAQEASPADQSSVVDLGAVEPDQAVSIWPTSKSEAKEEMTRDSEGLPDTAIVPVESHAADSTPTRVDASAIEVTEVQVEDPIPSLPQTPVKVVSEADHVDEASLIETAQFVLPEKLEQDWVDEEPPIAVPVPNAPSVKNDLHR